LNPIFQLHDSSGRSYSLKVTGATSTDGITIRDESASTEIARFQRDLNIGFNQTTFGTSAAKVLAIGSGSAPTTSPADAVQLWSADR